MSNWYETESWYAPLNSEPQAQQTEKPKRKKGWTAARVIGLCVIVIVLIAASSIAFGNFNVVIDEMPHSEDELPESFKDFFNDYYTSVTTDTADIKIPKYEGKTDSRIETVPTEGEAFTLQELYKNCVDSIVCIKAYSEGDMARYNWGSGVVISKDGLVLTNAHVIEGQSKAVVILGDDSEHEAELIGADSISDLAVLKIYALGLSPAQIGDSNLLTVGDKVAAIGNPLSSEFRLTLTDGIVSGIERDMRFNGHVMNLLQTNTAINNGNSGGALFNMYGQVIGITNMKMTSSYSSAASIEGIGFAIPSSTFAAVVNSLIEDGKVSGRTSIGITVGAIPEDVAGHYKLPQGVYVSDVIDKSDAAAKGVQIGDVITAVNGKSVKATTDIADVKDKLSVGDTITLTVWRNGETIDIDVILMDTNDLY